MTKEDKLFHFIAGLHTWVEVELQRQDIKCLKDATAIADALVDLRSSRPLGTPPNQEPKAKRRRRPHLRRRKRRPLKKQGPRLRVW